MAYASRNFRTKKALKDAVSTGERVTLYQPGGFFEKDFTNGTFAVEGPHFPEPHRWYATVTVQNGLVVKVK